MRNLTLFSDLLASCHVVCKRALREMAVRGRFSWPVMAVGLLAIAACSPMGTIPSSVSSVQTSPRLGTQWGEGRQSQVRTVQAYRISPDQPDDVVSVSYSDQAGVRSIVGPDADRQLNLLMARGDVEWAIHDESGRALPLQRGRQNRLSGRRGHDEQGQLVADGFHIAGIEGTRYTLVFRNLSDRRYEVVSTVDGLDVLSGQPGSLRQSGYVLEPHGMLSIEGFRKNQNEVAAFRFAAPGRAYAAHTEAGDVRNIGVIGAAIFELQMPGRASPPRRGSLPSRQPNAFPADGGTSYAPPPRY